MALSRKVFIENFYKSWIVFNEANPQAITLHPWGVEVVTGERKVKHTPKKCNCGTSYCKGWIMKNTFHSFENGKWKRTT